MSKEQLLISALATGEVGNSNRNALLEKKLQVVIAEAIAEFGLSLKENSVVVEDDIFGAALEGEHREEDEIPLGPCPMLPPD